MKGLPEDQAQCLIQEIETKATLRAIENKQRQLNILVKQIEEVKQSDPDSPELLKDFKLLSAQQKKLLKKAAFLKDCEELKFSSWKKKKVSSMSVEQYNQKVSTKKLKKKLQAKARKDRRKERQIKERAESAIARNLVINLTNINVPLFSIAVLSYGPGWIPCPKFDDMQFKVDGYNAGNKQCWKAVFKDSETSNDVPMSLLKKPVTSPCFDVEDSAIKSVKENITTFVENFKPKRLQSNMNRFEKEGYNWLKKAVNDGTVAITSADKGGAVIIVTPDLVKEITAAKVSDPLRYRPLSSDPTPTLKTRLMNLWKTGYNESYVSPSQARSVVGLLWNVEKGDFTVSTSDLVKPDTPYGYPLLKIHKLSEAELLAKKIPPSQVCN